MIRLSPIRHLRWMIRAGWVPMVVFGVHCILSLGLNAYERLSWLDVPMHLVGGVAIAYFVDHGLDYVCELELIPRVDVGSRYIMIFGLVAAATVFWEFGEFLADTFFEAASQQSVANVMKDQFFGLIGGCIYVGASMVKKR